MKKLLFATLVTWLLVGHAHAQHIKFMPFLTPTFSFGKIKVHDFRAPILQGGLNTIPTYIEPSEQHLTIGGLPGITTGLIAQMGKGKWFCESGLMLKNINYQWQTKSTLPIDIKYEPIITQGGDTYYLPYNANGATALPSTYFSNQLYLGLLMSFGVQLDEVLSISVGGSAACLLSSSLRSKNSLLQNQVPGIQSERTYSDTHKPYLFMGQFMLHWLPNKRVKLSIVLERMLSQPIKPSEETKASLYQVGAQFAVDLD